MKPTNLKEIVPDKNLIAFCGLYCGACGSYLSGKCPGCKDNVKASWCKVRSCCIDQNILSCSDCKTVELNDCKKFNNPMSKVFGFIFNSDRAACVNRINEIGYDEFAIEMTAYKRQSIKRR
jgi:hypothetical protein